MGSPTLSKAILRPDVHTVFDPETFTATHIVVDPQTKRTAIIDAVLDYDPKAGRTSTGTADKVITCAKSNGLGVDWVLETHVHADHLTAAPYLVSKLGGRTGIGARVPIVQGTFKKAFNAEPTFRTDGSQFDHLFADGETFSIGNLEAKVIFTPGHTPACVSYLIGDAVFVGDTLFMWDYGTARCDFPGGDAKTLYESIERILSLPDETRMFLCHDYKAEGRDHFQWETTVGEQRAKNVHLQRAKTPDDFAALREARDKDLDMPVLILPSVQVNMRAGALPPKEENGISYLKIPVNYL